MLLISCLVAVILLCVLLAYLDVGVEIPTVGIVVTGIALFVTLVILPVTRYETNMEIVGFKQVKEDVSIARKSNLDPVERASLTRTIIEQNTWLAKKKVINEGFWDIFIPDEVDELQKLQ